MGKMGKNLRSIGTILFWCLDAEFELSQCTILSVVLMWSLNGQILNYQIRICGWTVSLSSSNSLNPVPYWFSCFRVNLGPHEDIAKIYLMNKENTNEIRYFKIYISFVNLCNKSNPTLISLHPQNNSYKSLILRKKIFFSHKVAQYLRFSYAELRSFLSMFYEEEEREADRIR